MSIIHPNLTNHLPEQVNNGVTLQAQSMSLVLKYFDAIANQKAEDFRLLYDKNIVFTTRYANEETKIVGIDRVIDAANRTFSKFGSGTLPGNLTLGFESGINMQAGSQVVVAQYNLSGFSGLGCMEKFTVAFKQGQWCITQVESELRSVENQAEVGSKRARS